MSDPWSRPDDGAGPRPPTDGVVEVELDGPETPTGQVGPDDGDHPPNWRQLVAVASVAGAALGLVVGAIVLTGDDDESTPDADEQVDVVDVTTPDTLPPVVTDPTVPPLATTPVIADAPHLPLERTSYPDATLPSQSVERFTLDEETLAANTANSVSIEVTSEDGLGPIRISMEHDPTTGRYLVSYDERGPVQRLLVAPDEGLVYAMPRARNDGRWAVTGPPDIADATAEELDVLLRSPVRPEILAVETANADGAVVLESGEIAQRYTMTIQSFRIPEWTAGVDGPVFPGGGHVFEAYVDERGRLAAVEGSVVVDGVRRLIAYRFDHDADVSIELPTPDETIPEPN